MADDPNTLNRGAGAYSTPGVDPPFTPKDFVPQSSRPGVIFRLTDVEPPSPLYVRQEDNLGFLVLNSDPLTTFVQLNGRLLRASDGKVTVFQQVLPVTSDSQPNQVAVNLAEGYLLSLMANPQTTNKRGRCYVRVLLSAVGNNTPLTQSLISDYASVGHVPAWPNGEYVAASEGPGWSQSLQVGNPAAGADFSTTVPNGARWRIQSMVATLVTSAAVANRVPTFIIDDGVNILFQVDAIAAQAASLTKTYCLTAGQTAATGAGNTISLPLPGPEFLLAGFRVRTSTAGIQAADQWSAISLNIETWIDR